MRSCDTESVKGVFGAAGLHLRPGVNAALVVDAEAGQSCNGLPLKQLLQADRTLAAVFTEHVRVVGQGRRGEAAQQVVFNATSGKRLGAERAADISMAIVDSIKPDPSLRNWPRVCAPDAGGPGAHAAGRGVPIPGQPLRESAVRRAACILPGLVFSFDGGLGAHATVLVGLYLAGAVRHGRGGGLAVDARGNAAAVVVMVVVVVVVRGAPIRARPVLPQVRVAAFLRPTSIGLRVLEAPGEVHHEAGRSGAAGSAVGFPFGAVFPEGCWREDWVFLEAARSGPHL